MSLSGRLAFRLLSQEESDHGATGQSRSQEDRGRHEEVPRMRRGCRRCRSNGSSNNGKGQNDMHCHVSRAFVFLNCVDVASPWRDVATSMACFK